MSGYNIITLFLKTESLTFISRFIFCAFPEIKDRSYSNNGSAKSLKVPDLPRGIPSSKLP